jgi:DNA modification methylase
MCKITSMDSLPLDSILVGDCLQVLAGLPEKSIDVVFADPPYNLQLQNELWRPNLTRVSAVDDAWDKFNGNAEYDQFTRQWLSECRRVLKDTGTLWVIGSYHNIYRVGAILMDLGYWILNDIVWIKTNPMPNFRGVRFTNAHETLLWAQKRKGARYTFNHHAMKALNDGLQMRSDWVIPICSGKERLKYNGFKAHSTQKPEALLYRVLLSSTQPGDVVLDPFFGSGTTGAMARKLQRHWIGIERDPHYVALAQERIDALPEQALDPSIYSFPSRRGHPRLPLGALLACGMLQPGQTLYFDKSSLSATLLADGALLHADQTGTIHQLARLLKNAPCNGWEHWYYHDEVSNRLLPLDVLRQEYLRLAALAEQSPEIESAPEIQMAENPDGSENSAE